MEEPETTAQTGTDEVATTGFQVSEEPVVQSAGAAGPQLETTSEAMPAASPLFSDGMLHLIARDPRSLFISWSLDLTKRLAETVQNRGPIHARVLREDGTEETATEIDPEVGYAFVGVSLPGGRYTSEVGVFAGSRWTALARSSVAKTPKAARSEDEAADFATLPFHLSFQRLLDIFRSTGEQRKTLARSVGEMQAGAGALQASMSEADWSKLSGTAAASVDLDAGLGWNGIDSSEIAALLRKVRDDQRRRTPSPEQLARLRKLSESIGGSSWSGGSSDSFGQRSRG